MAEKKDIDYLYTTIDEIFRLSMGETSDFSGAMYNGDFSMSLEEAQNAKHEFMATQLHIGNGSKVLDMGSGWGPFLKFIKEKRKADGIGLTLSDGQYNACKKNGLNVFIKDCRTITPADFGTFDAVVSVGAFEHFCSIEEYRAGLQEKIYTNFFQSVYNLLPSRGRFYLQTMAFGKNMIPYEEIDINAPKDSNANIMGLMVKFFPGSWLPYGSEMIIKTAAPFFKVIFISSGRLDYIETTNQWRKRIRKFSLKKYGLVLRMLPKFFISADIRNKVAVFRRAANKKCFERELFDHFRIVFQKIDG